jgi:hypothetical protein
MSQLFLKYRQLGVAVPGGIEIAWHTVDAALQRMEADADGDADDMPVALAWDAEDAFPNCWRSEMFAKTQQYVPSLLAYTQQLYGGNGTIMAISKGELIRSWTCRDGVWQGDPLGVHHMVLSVLGFVQEMLEFAPPDLAMHEHQTSRLVTAVHVAIADDLTQVVRRRHVLQLARWMVRTAPKYGLRLNLTKWQIYMPRHRHEHDVTQLALCQTLQAMGSKVSAGATSSFLGHSASINRNFNKC